MIKGVSDIGVGAEPPHTKGKSLKDGLQYSGSAKKMRKDKLHFRISLILM